ncbi:2-C-methyl-D-erythritol 4-phosphate cytidylyltransferase [Methanococcus maripaludis]|uniref:2-C-methyl-D-erythritol 4-phosphate cytidylyltransferase n=1 Tax=Methanococcus maripaludis TaxID=39152 RepID=A0A8T4CK73_METMI|nr:2-C-methyl-D-erythritol 4-phosphate cytidylyltransferase [Methanococcus maripaludis]MBM7409120.1 2-C-methyl-D-erythritol 4-phosphate cytidylyltransferase [Methanococcus maripaludis]MBP2218694.1 2-C-methyl-D-erythritol 4-phosphate cytidylyltransferase [Methanococcus maripaludis]
MKNIAIVLSAGSGTRMGNEVPKQYMKLAGKPVFQYCIEEFSKSSKIDEIYMVISKEDQLYVEEILKKFPNKVSKIIFGGRTRQESSRAGVYALPKNTDKVLIHDAARPFLNLTLINEVIDTLDYHNCVDVAISSDDTIIKIDCDKYIESIPDRNYLLRGQTPQGFKYPIILDAHNMSEKEDYCGVTDDCGLIIHYGLSKVYVIDGNSKNIKITKPIDLYISEKLCQLNSLSLMENTKKDSRKKTYIIYGHSYGIGHEIFELLKKEGHNVYGFSRSSGCDISDHGNIISSLKKVYDSEGKIDGIIVTAGIMHRNLLQNKNYSEIIDEININYVSSVLVTKESLKYLEKSGGGHIILYGSSSYTRGRESYSIYSSTKAALVNFVQAVADEVYSKNILVNIVVPERTKTPLREKNFGIEDPKTLLNPKYVAEKTLEILNLNVTGQTFDIKKK